MSFEFRKFGEEPNYEEVFSSRNVYKRIGIELLRSSLAYFSFVFISSVLFSLFFLVYVSITPSYERVPTLMYVVSSLSIPFTLYSTLRSFELYDKESQITFLRIDGKYSFKNDLKAIYNNPTLRLKILTRLGVFLFFILVLPYTVGFKQLVGCFYPELDMPVARANLIAKAIMCPITLLLLHVSTASAHKWWLLGSDLSRDKILNCRHCNLRVFLEQIKIFVIYGISFYLLPEALLMIIGLFSTLLLFRDLTILIWFIGIVAFLVIIYYLRAFKLRGRFLKRLYKLAEDEGWEITKIPHPYLSVIKPSAAADFTLKKEGRAFSCKLIGSVRRRNPTYIDYDGKITDKVTVSIMKVELFHFLIDSDYTFSGEGQKIVILAPEPKRIFLNQGRTDVAPDSQDMRYVMSSAKGGKVLSPLLRTPVTKLFQTGDRVGEYKFFTSEGFLSAMDNNVLHR